MSKKSTIPLKERIRAKNVKYYNKKRADILRHLFYRNIKRRITTQPNRHTITKNGLTPEKILELKSDALEDAEASEKEEIERYYTNLHNFVKTRLKSTAGK